VVDLNSLPPSEMARLLGKPEGEAGIAISKRLNQINAGITSAVYQSLQLRRGERILEIGFANGKLLPELLSCADDLSYAGIDIASTMVDAAKDSNADLVASGRATFELASADEIPHPDASFDRVFAVNVIYFWPDPVRALAEMRRVLRPDGLSIVAAVNPDPQEPPPPFVREEFGFRARDAEAVVALHREAGFGQVGIEDYEEIVPRPDGTPWKRRYAIVSARR
jgi:ubiquinone/menaquinone biosynthesis C-methylase UbiE